MSDETPIITTYDDDRINLPYWFDRLESTGVPVPKTHIVELEKSDTGGIPVEWDTNELVSIVDDFGGEAFLRSGFASAGDLQAGSYIDLVDPDHVDETVMELLFGHLSGHTRTGGVLVVRERLDIDFNWYARGPCNPELRFFIEDGDVKYGFPRLETDDFQSESDVEDAKWACEMGFDDAEEYARQVAAEFTDDAWSVDFVLDRDWNWWCTDMAIDGLYWNTRGQVNGRWQNLSYHQPGSEYNLAEQYADRLPDGDEVDDPTDVSLST